MLIQQSLIFFVIRQAQYFIIVMNSPRIALYISQTNNNCISDFEKVQIIKTHTQTAIRVPLSATN